MYPKSHWFGWTINPTSHVTILIVVLALLVIQSTLNITGAKVMGRVAQFGVYVEILGPRHRDRARHPRVPPQRRVPVSTQGVQNVKTNGSRGRAAGCPRASSPWVAGRGR